MTTDMTTGEHSRRGLLLAGLGAAAAAATAAVARFAPAAAADGDTVTVGSANTGDNATTFTSDSSNALGGTSNSAKGVDGMSTSGQGVHGQSSSSAGVAGVSDSGVGVHGTSTSNRGVYGQSTSGAGVEASGATGLKAESTDNGFAIDSTAGRVRFQGISGSATIPAGETRVTVKPGVPINSQTMMLLSAQSDNGSRAVWWSHNQSAGELIIHLSSSRNNPTKISYLVLEHA